MQSTIKNYFFSLNSLSGRIAEIFFLLINLTFCVTTIIESYFPKNELLYKIDYCLLIIVIIEYFLRLFSEERKVRYIFWNFYSIIDLITILSSFLIYISPYDFDLGFIKVFYLLKPLRIVRFARYLQSEEFFFGKITNYHLKISRLIISLFIVFFLASGMIYSAEYKVNNGINNFGDGFYYAVVTLTTVGFGDITPVTETGKWVTVLMILMGIVVIPWQAGQIIKEWFKLYNKSNLVCPGCNAHFHDFDANYCKICGNKLPSLKR